LFSVARKFKKNLRGIKEKEVGRRGGELRTSYPQKRMGGKEGGATRVENRELKGERRQLRLGTFTPTGNHQWVERGKRRLAISIGNVPSK